MRPAGADLSRRQLGRYELIACIGRGGMAEVQLARMRGAMGFEKLVVLKLVHEHLASRKSFVEMLMQEARLAALIKHPSVVDIYDLGESEGRYFVAMEYLAGEPLLAVLRAGREGPRLDPLSTGRLIAEVAEGLSAAHQLRLMTGEAMPVVHHDISLGNIMVLYTGQAKLVDFGVAKAGGKTPEDHDRVKGKFGYMAPEKLQGEGGDARSDLFSLGVVLWEALTLRRLFRADSELDAIRQVLKNPIPSPSSVNSDVPKAFDRICERALQRDVTLRYQTAAEIATDIEDVLRQSSYSGKYETIAQYMRLTFAEHIQARTQLIKEAATVAGPSEQVVSAAFSPLSGAPLRGPDEATMQGLVLEADLPSAEKVAATPAPPILPAGEAKASRAAAWPEHEPSVTDIMPLSWPEAQRPAATPAAALADAALAPAPPAAAPSSAPVATAAGEAAAAESRAAAEPRTAAKTAASQAAAKAAPEARGAKSEPPPAAPEARGAKSEPPPAAPEARGAKSEPPPAAPEARAAAKATSPQAAAKAEPEHPQAAKPSAPASDAGLEPAKAGAAPVSSVPALFASITKSSPPKPFAMPTIAPRTAKASQPPPTRGPLAGKLFGPEELERTEVTAAPRQPEDKPAGPAKATSALGAALASAPAAQEATEEKTDAAPIIDSISSGGAVAGEVAPRAAGKDAEQDAGGSILAPRAAGSSGSLAGHRAESPLEAHATSGEHAVAAMHELAEHTTVGSTTALTRAPADQRKRWIVGGAIALGALITAVAIAASGGSSGQPETPATLSSSASSATFPGATRTDEIALAPEVRAAARPGAAGEATNDTTGGATNDTTGGATTDTNDTTDDSADPATQLPRATAPASEPVPAPESPESTAAPETTVEPASVDRPRDSGRRKRDQDKRDQDKRDVRKPDLDVEATFKTGQTAFLRGDAKGALTTFRKVLAASPGFAPAWRGAALAHEKLGQKSAAAKALRKYLKLAPSAADAALIRARLERLE